MVRAVADVGSNSILLLVSETRGSTWIPILERSTVTGLGVGTKRTGLLQEPGIASTLQILREYSKIALSYGAPGLRSGATMAVRMASNQGAFCKRAADQGTPIEILSGEDEAQLGMEAVTTDPLFQGTRRLSMIDPGGHSTELVTSDQTKGLWETRYRRSYAIGALGLRETTVTTERADPKMIMQAVRELDDKIGLCYLPDACGTVVTLGATGTNLITIRDHILEWDSQAVHGQRLSYEEISRAAQWLLAMTDSERSAIPGIEPGRERTLHIGALILERFMFGLRAEHCVVSTRGWRHAFLEQADPAKK